MLSKVASEAGVGGGGDGWSSSKGKVSGDAGAARAAGAVDKRSYDNNEPSKKAFDFDLVMISLFGSTGKIELGTTELEAEERRIDFRVIAFVFEGPKSAD